jgi:hypothetical protein
MRRLSPFILQPSALPIAAALLALAVVSAGRAAGPAGPAPRPPAVPLVTHDPYFSVWSPADRLTDRATVHWTGRPQNLRSMARIDGRTYRLMGAEPKEVEPLPQTGLTVLPTRTVYTFANAQARVILTFTTPLLPDNLDLLARPATYLTWEARSLDDRKHRVDLYFDAGTELVVNTPDQPVRWQRERIPGLHALRCGTEEQPVLQKTGDNLRIDWGYLYLALPTGPGASAAVGDGEPVRAAFAAQGELPARDDARMPRAPRDGAPVLAAAFSLGSVGASAVARHLLLAYDDQYAIEYFGKPLRPYWRRRGMDAGRMLQAAEEEYGMVTRRCAAFDERLLADLRRAGGEQYERLGALLYRQAVAGNKLAADANGMPLLFPKECFSNGCIATVDVIYPMAPLFLLTSPALARAMLVSNLDYAASPRWKWPFAPHDLGTYPKANGQVYGGGERTEENQMPVEESGNMLLMVAALCRAEHSAAFAQRYWTPLTRWAQYLREKGMDPENQLCTDDFAGHLAHNVNLSGKAILALGAYAGLCEQSGRSAEAEEYRRVARDFAARWVRMAAEGDHTRLAFDRPDTWSQKYNLVWDRVLDLRLFPPEVARREVAFYEKIQNRYGVPLDNRRDWTKLDWITWSASLADSPAGFERLIAPVNAFLQDTPQRVPASDWYLTTSARQAGFQARPVVGGAFVRLLQDPAVWAAWVARGAKANSTYAPSPASIRRVPAVPTAEQEPVPWRYTFERPAEGWFQPGFDAAGWKTGPAGFGTPGTPGAVVRTRWDSADIWLRRDFTLGNRPLRAPSLRLHHDEDAEVYLNGVLAASANGYTTAYQETTLSPAAARALRPGSNLMAIHCHQTTGGQYIDAGLSEEAR